MLVGLGLGTFLVWTGGTPSQAGPQLKPVAHPLAAGSEDAFAPSSTRAATPVVGHCTNAPGVPVSITVDGAHAQNTPIEAHPLGYSEDGKTYTGSLYVPTDPTHASWLDYFDVGPGADHGTAVLTSHVNYDHVQGAFGDLTAYKPGQHISVKLADGRTISYHVVTAASMGFATTDTALEVTKDDLDSDPALNRRIFDFTDSWAPPGGPACGRLVIVTCSGTVVDHNYLDNAFVFALPDNRD